MNSNFIDTFFLYDIRKTDTIFHDNQSRDNMETCDLTAPPWERFLGENDDYINRLKSCHIYANKLGNILAHYIKNHSLKTILKTPTSTMALYMYVCIATEDDRRYMHEYPSYYGTQAYLLAKTEIAELLHAYENFINKKLPKNLKKYHHYDISNVEQERPVDNIDNNLVDIDLDVF